MPQNKPIGYIAICIRSDEVYQRGQFVSNQCRPTEDINEALVWYNPKIGLDNFRKIPLYRDNNRFCDDLIKSLKESE